MGPIYSRLFKYRPTEKLNPRENFLTESLCHLLTWMPQEDTHRFLCECFRPHGGKHAWLESTCPQKRMTWQTQLAAGGRRPDLIGSLGELPAILIEVKDGAPFQNKQLEDYGKWLAAANPKATLAVLTHARKPPSDFNTGLGYGVAPEYRSVARWTEVSKWLSKQSQKAIAPASQRPAWINLAAELSEFLKEQNMAGETMDFYDVSALELYIRSARKVDNTAVQIGAELKRRLGGLASGARSTSLDKDGSGGLTSEKIELGAAGYLIWGIHFPSSIGTTWWKTVTPSLPDTPFIFVYAACDEDKSVAFDRLQEALGTTGKWKMISEAGLEDWDEPYPIAVCPLHSFKTDKAELGQKMIEWMGERADEVVSAVRRKTPK